MDQIRDGSYTPGSQVPSELEIAGQHRVSRMTARKALDALVAKGILYRQKGKGTYVTDNVVSYGLSTMLSFSRTLQTQGYHVTTRILLMDVAPASAEVLTKLQLSAGSQVIIVRRLRLIEGKPAAIHTSFLEHRLFAPILNIDLSTESLLDAIQNISRMPVAYTRDSVQADIANADMATLLQIEIGSPVLKVEGVTYSENGEATRFTKAVYRADMFKLIVKNDAGLAASLDVSATFKLRSIDGE
jgi:GntR family transcriptional regulator